MKFIKLFSILLAINIFNLKCSELSKPLQKDKSTTVQKIKRKKKSKDNSNTEQPKFLMFEEASKPNSTNTKHSYTQLLDKPINSKELSSNNSTPSSISTPQANKSIPNQKIQNLLLLQTQLNNKLNPISSNVYKAQASSNGSTDLTRAPLKQSLVNYANGLLNELIQNPNADFGYNTFDLMSMSRQDAISVVNYIRQSDKVRNGFDFSLWTHDSSAHGGPHDKTDIICYSRKKSTGKDGKNSSGFFTDGLNNNTNQSNNSSDLNSNNGSSSSTPKRTCTLPSKPNTPQERIEQSIQKANNQNGRGIPSRPVPNDKTMVGYLEPVVNKQGEIVDFAKFGINLNLNSTKNDLINIDFCYNGNFKGKFQLFGPEFKGKSPEIYNDNQTFGFYTHFSQFDTDYIEALRIFPCHERLILSIDNQLYTNTNLRNNLTNSIINDIKNEADLIRFNQRNREQKVRANLRDKYFKSLDFTKLDLTNPKIDFAKSGYFSKTPDSFDLYVSYKDQSAYTKEETVKKFNLFFKFTDPEYIAHLKRDFPEIFNGFIKNHNEQLQSNPEFQHGLNEAYDIHGNYNGDKIIKVIESEAIRIKNLNAQPGLKKVRNSILSNFRRDKNSNVLKERLRIFDEMIVNPKPFTFSMKLSDNAKKLLPGLKIDAESLETNTGNLVQQTNHVTFVNAINESAEIYAKYSEQEVKDYLATTIEVANKGIALNRENNLEAAYGFVDATNDMKALFKGADNAFKDNGKGLIEFLKHPISGTFKKGKELGILVKNVTVSTAKAIMWSVAYAPDHEFYNPEIEAINNQAIQAKADEIKQVAEVLLKTFDSLPREKKLEQIGYLITDYYVSGWKGNLTANTLSQITDVQKNVERGKKLLEGLGEIGDDVARITGLAVEKGAKFVNDKLDKFKANPKFVTAEGLVFEFVDDVKQKGNLLKQDVNDKSKKVIDTAKNVTKPVIDTAKKVTQSIRTAADVIKETLVNATNVYELEKFAEKIPGGKELMEKIDKLRKEAVLLEKAGKQSDKLGNIAGHLFEADYALGLSKQGVKIEGLGKKIQEICSKTKKLINSAREFDIVTFDRLIELKNRDYGRLSSSEIGKIVDDLKKDLPVFKNIAQSVGKVYEYHSNHSLPKEMKAVLDKYGVKYVEILKRSLL